MSSLVVIGPQIKEKQRGAHCAPPAYMVPKDPSLNRVKDIMISKCWYYWQGSTSYAK